MSARHPSSGLPILQDDVIKLDALRTADFREHYELDSDKEVARRLGWDGAAIELSAPRTTAWAQRCARAWREGTSAFWVVRFRSVSKMLGFVNLRLVGVDPPWQAEISYALHPAARGQGVATRAVRIACGFGA